MEVFVYAIIFIIGTFFGSFFTLAVYRIPKKEDILIKHSYCPNCNHKLGFFDLFPVLSYLFLGAKCRYCKNKIRPRYFILEILAGMTFTILAISLKFNIFNGESIVNLIFLLIYVSVLFIIAGIDKEKNKIEKSVLVFGYVVGILYMIYQCTLGKFNVYQYVMYLILIIIALIIVKMCIKKQTLKEYYRYIIYMFFYILMFSNFQISFITLVLSLLAIVFCKLIRKPNKITVPIGFVIVFNNIITIVILNSIVNYVL